MKRAFLPVLFGSLLFVGCLRSENTAVEVNTGTGANIGEEIYARVMPSKKEGVTDAVHGKETWFAYGAVTGTEGNSANGVATAHYLQDQTYILGIQLNINPPDDGEFYEGWLLPPGTGREWVSIGHFKQGEREARQTIRFENKTDHRNKLKLAITREKDDGNAAPGEVVADGTLHVTKR